MIELKKCPFCGSEPRFSKLFEYGIGKGYWVVCDECGIEQGKLYSSKQNAAKAWNRRKDD